MSLASFRATAVLLDWYNVLSFKFMQTDSQPPGGRRGKQGASGVSPGPTNESAAVSLLMYTSPGSLCNTYCNGRLTLDVERV